MNTAAKPIIQKKIRKVAFSKTVIVTGILHNKDYTPEEKKSCWYSATDQRRMKEECAHTVQLFRNQRHCQQDEHRDDQDHHPLCCRGLENRINPDYRRKNTRDAARAMVLSEQRKGVKDLEILANRYRTISSSCEIKAYRMGLMDQIHASSTLPSSSTSLKINNRIRPMIVPLEECAIAAKSKPGPLRDLFSRMTVSPSPVKRNHLLQRNACAA